MERSDEIAEMITREVGKTIRESREEMVEYTADHFRRASEDVLRYAGKVLPSTQERTGDKRIVVVQEPVGVVAAVTPWNFPVDIAGIPIVYGLAVGCTAVWKPSEYAPLCANMFAEVIHDAGFPAGTLNVVHGRGDVGAALVRHPDVGAVVFTGSSHTGEQVARDAALKSRVLELGGNGPQIVLADANIGKAADAAIVGCFYLAGQCCTAAERILVHESVKDAFVEALTERTKALKVGDPLDEETDMGPLCTPLDEALEIANETDYGLTASVFTRSLHDAWHAAEELRHGTVHINETTNYWDQLAPFGGAKKSGAGRELAGWMLDALTETKQITFDLGD
jgi:succinate-semialdehyde dehydrogenase/glutarate-semialdehyde dehydrogenase